MPDIFRISDASNIKLTGGVQQHGNCSVTDSRDANTITCLEAGAQNCGGNDLGDVAGGISSVYVGDCLTGSGTVDLPIELVLNPTGGIACGPDGLYTTNFVVVTGVIDTTVYTSGCINGSGTLSDPLVVLLNPTGGIQCTAAGLAVQFPVPTGLNNVSTVGCLSGNGTAGSPLTVSVNPTGGLHCTAGGLAIQTTYLTSIVSSGCLTGSGTTASPARVLLNPTGGIQCTAGGLAVQFPASTGLNNVSTVGCLSGNGTAGSPLTVSLNPTGGIQCTSGGLAINATTISSVTTAGCVSGVGTSGNPIVVLLNPTGGIHCTPNGLAINMALVTSSGGGGGCIAVSSESGTAPTSPTQPTTPMTNLSSGNIQLEFYNNVVNVWFYNGSNFVLDKVFSGSGGSGSGIPNGDAGDIIVTGNGSGLNFDSGVITSFSRTLLDDSSQSAWRTTLGLGTAATAASTDFAAASHNHNASEIVSGVISPSRLGSGTPVAGTYLSATGWVELSTVSGSDYFMGETNEGNSGSAITVSFVGKANHKLTLTNHCTLTFTPPTSARDTKIRFVQGGSGGYTITLPSGTLGDTPVIPTGVGSQAVVSFYYDGDGSWHV